jgi:hypothetical protein
MASHRAARRAGVQAARRRHRLGCIARDPPHLCGLARLLAAGTFQGRGLVVTTTDARSFRTHFKGPAQGLCILQKPYDIDMMLRLLELIPRAPMLDMGAACYATPALELRPEP